MDRSQDRYRQGEYDCNFGDGLWKGKQMARLIEDITDKGTIRRVADVGCGDGSVAAEVQRLSRACGFAIEKMVGYDISPISDQTRQRFPQVEFRNEDFFQGDEKFDLITLNDVVEHVLSPQVFLGRIAQRARYVALHIPMDDRGIVRFLNQYNYRIGPVGHVSFWNPATALNLLTASGLLPIRCRFTPGFMAPSSGRSLMQWIARPLRLMAWLISPAWSATTIGGVSMAVLCRGSAPE